MTRWRHNKTGNYYALLAHGTDCTNSRGGTRVAVYSPENDPHTIYVREWAEFEEKFTPCAHPPTHPHKEVMNENTNMP